VDSIIHHINFIFLKILLHIQEQFNIDRLKRAATRGQGGSKFSELDSLSTRTSLSSSSSSSQSRGCSDDSLIPSSSLNRGVSAKKVNRSSVKRNINSQDKVKNNGRQMKGKYKSKAKGKGRAIASRKGRRKGFSDVELHDLDPIMMVPLTSHIFKYMRPNGDSVCYNVDSLVDYMLLTGDFADPQTRIPFTNQELNEIDAIAANANLGKPSLIQARSNLAQLNDIKFRRDALTGLERCAGEVVADILMILETYDMEEAQMRLVLREFPLFADYYRQLKAADPEFAHQCLACWREYIKGPPNCPTQEFGELVGSTLNFLNSCGDN
jgi:hypothetical protein